METKKVNTESSLMRLKKQELVNIILRKDDVEVKHNDEIKELKANLTNCENSLNSANGDIDNLEYQLKNLKDTITLCNNKYDKLYRKYSETQSIASAHKRSRDEMAKNCVNLQDDLDAANIEIAKYKRRATVSYILLSISIIIGVLGFMF